jgi:hypothetical protein
MRRATAWASFLIASFTLHAAAAPPSSAPSPPLATLKEALEPAPRDGGFAMPDYFLWCSSVVKVGDTYHLFASRWPAKFGMGGWTNYSECVRATSKTLLGPYTFQEVVLQKRADSWDKSRVHNVKIVRIPHEGKETFVIFYINSANQTGYAYSDSVLGPWTRSDKPVMNASNPAPLVMPDDSLYVFCRLRDSNQINRGIAFTAPTFKGPYTVLEHGDNLLPGGAELEDPTIWFAHGQYNLLMNDWKGHATGVMKDGAQYFSKDGVHYTLMSKEPVFTKTLKYADGTDETFARRERPFVYMNEKGEIEALFTACFPKGDGAAARITAQPVKDYVPSN